MLGVEMGYYGHPQGIPCKSTSDFIAFTSSYELADWVPSKKKFSNILPCAIDRKILQDIWLNWVI